MTDPRLTPARPDLAAAHLEGRVEAARFVAGRRLRVRTPSVDLRRDPQPDAVLDTEALYGEEVVVYEEREGWAWGQLAADGYVGYLPADALEPVADDAPTHKIAVLRSFMFPGPDIKQPPAGALPLGARVRPLERRGAFWRIDGGFVWARHVVPAEAMAADFVSVAERFLGVPYLWGGKTALGLDCSGLVQVALAAAGRTVSRDADMQERELAVPVRPGETLGRGDLLFWRDHVGIMRDARTLLHANGTDMMVSSEVLADVLRRRDTEGGGPVTGVARLGAGSA